MSIFPWTKYWQKSVGFLQTSFSNRALGWLFFLVEVFNMEQNAVGCLLNVPDRPSFWLLGLPRWTWEAADESWTPTLQSPYLICCGFLCVALQQFQVGPRSGSAFILMLCSCILNFELKYTVWKIFNKKIEKNHKKEKKRKVLNAIYDGVIFHSTQDIGITQLVLSA